MLTPPSQSDGCHDRERGRGVQQLDDSRPTAILAGSALTAAGADSSGLASEPCTRRRNSFWDSLGSIRSDVSGHRRAFWGRCPKDSGIAAGCL